MPKKTHPHRPSKTQEIPWQPSEKDAVNLALLQYYASTIEGLSVMIYRSDPRASRPKFGSLQRALHHCIEDLQRLARSGAPPRGSETGQVKDSRSCPNPGEKICSDGLCHDIDDPTCCD